MIGYACMHHEARFPHRATTGRTVRLKTRQAGLGEVSQKALQNAEDLLHILRWNVQMGFGCFRISSIFPWLDTYDVHELPDWKSIEPVLGACTDTIRDHGLRITTHPGQYVCLASPNPKTVEASIKELNAHGKMMDLLGLPRTPWSKINIHIGGTYTKNPSGADLEVVGARFAEAFLQLDESVQTRLTLENDDKPNCWSVHGLLDWVLPQIKARSGFDVPLVFDSLHWQLGPQTDPRDKSYSLCLGSAARTWGAVVPIVHHSESRDGSTAHSDAFTTLFPNPEGIVVDVMLEAKHKEVAGLGYLALEQALRRTTSRDKREQN